MPLHTEISGEQCVQVCLSAVAIVQFVQILHDAFLRLGMCMNTKI